MDLRHFGGCNNEVAGLQSDCYTEVALYLNFVTRISLPELPLAYMYLDKQFSIILLVTFGKSSCEWFSLSQVFSTSKRNIIL